MGCRGAALYQKRLAAPSSHPIRARAGSDHRQGIAPWIPLQERVRLQPPVSGGRPLGPVRRPFESSRPNEQRNQPPADPGSRWATCVRGLSGQAGGPRAGRQGREQRMGRLSAKSSLLHGARSRLRATMQRRRARPISSVAGAGAGPGRRPVPGVPLHHGGRGAAADGHEFLHGRDARMAADDKTGRGRPLAAVSLPLPGTSHCLQVFHALFSVALRFTSPHLLYSTVNFTV